MTVSDRESFDKQAAHWRKRADQQGGVVNHATWRNGHLECQIGPRPGAQEPEWEPRNRRGVSQGRLI